MSGIGGMMAPERGAIRQDWLLEMSRSLMLRGAERRGAYWNGGAGLFCGQRGEEIWQPAMICRKGVNYVAVVDGKPRGRGDFWGMPSSLGMEGGNLALECYCALGTDFIDALGGEYAMAIWDEGRKELILARDESGRYPLFYRMEGGELFFASEIKGLLRTLPEGAFVDRGRLRRHLFSAPGIVGGEDLYREVSAIPVGCGGVFSRMGMTVFSANTEKETEENLSAGGEAEVVCPEQGAFEQLLTEALFAFDYPQFDGFMPWLFREMEVARRAGVSSLDFADGTRWMSLPYAREREDRLGELYGVSLRGHTPARSLTREREWKRMDRVLGKLLSGSVETELNRILGVGWLSVLEQEKNLLKRIRMEGMLYQTVIWEREYRIIWE
ncbi:MAG: hypothetical protein IJY47_08065 [Clostridia bacterium]|nr:hypothetical protein [Clostridia bacterium]